VGANAAGKISDEELLAIENHACPRRRVRWPIHRQHNGHCDGDHWLVPMGQLPFRKWTHRKMPSLPAVAN